ncbi:MAG TPA: DUF6519 domain-containing protein [Burkholderiaceae bacterium]|nr:DUF6519 domain-containing protein [Burkholderiaceae bacterium]
MKGDFSVWRFDQHDNDQGVLYQQGRVMRDADLTAGELIGLHWKKQAGRDVIGAAVAAVPATEPDGFKVVSAAVAGSPAQVHLKVQPGRLWADGLLAYLPDDPATPGVPVDRVATYFGPPICDPTPTVASIGDGVRDAVVLEVNLEELNGFQDPARLLEAALGGPDTAERIHTRCAFRLLRLAANENCDTIAAKLKDDPSAKGKLSVSLQPATVVPSECPVVAGGGYTGFEHNLYRIEIADTTGAAVRFKWSQFNGALVGRGEFDATATPKRCVITANRTAIVTSGLTEFYLEALQFDAALGYWRVVYGAQANLNSDHDLELTDPPVFGAFPATAEGVFLRLWNGLASVVDFTNSATPVELRDGIRLVFDAPASANYRPGDYWTFTVRAGEITNPQVLIDNRPPAGPHYHRVPLAEIDWTARLDTTVEGNVEDCRKRFRPLTNQKVCCSFLVGDGISSFGDFNSLEEAAAHLPAGGGELCLLPGLHFANLELSARHNVTVHGCPRRTLVLPRLAHAADPIIHVRGGTGLRIYDLDLVAPFGAAVVCEAGDQAPAKDVRVEDCRMLARTYCVRVNGAEDVAVARNRMWLLDTPQGKVAISLKAVGALIERNVLGVWPFEMKPPGTDGGDGGKTPDPSDPCQDPATLYANIQFVRAYSVYVWATAVLAAPAQPYTALGGIHLLGSCERVRVLENVVDGGGGHGVTLGGLLPGETLPSGTTDGATSPSVTLAQPSMVGYTQDQNNQPLADIDVFLSAGATPAAQDRSDAQGYFEMKLAQGTYQVSVGPGWRIVELRQSEFEGGPFYVLVLAPGQVTPPDEAAFLYEITIQENEIVRMALSGIGFRRFSEQAGALPTPTLSDPESIVEYLSAILTPRELLGAANVVRDLMIRGNRIHDNLRAVFDDELRKQVQTIGQGGISLGLTESAVIADNLIYENGGSAVNPICGIFIGAGEDLQITSNRITANGALSADYETARLEGVRGGVFVRFATAFVAGGTADANQKPALRIEDNRIDQPAGRAITAYAFGPVSCVGNFLNSERAGRWNILDALIGAVLILNLGGIHRLLRFGQASNALDSGAGSAAFLAAPKATIADFRNQALAELVLPGGEVLFNSNQVRMGPLNRTFISQLLVTLDDSGYDGNQSAAFRSDLLFANALVLANTVRTTDNRWREDADACYFSLLSYAVTMNASLSPGMNTCAHNQGDHCIVPLAAAPIPVVDDGNLERNRSFCQRIEAEPNTLNTYLLQGLVAVWASQNAGSIKAQQAPGLAQKATVQSVNSVMTLQASYQQAYLGESQRLTGKYGADSPRVIATAQRAQKNAVILQQLRVEGELASITQPQQPDTGAVLDGRVVDPAYRGRSDLKIDLVRKDGTAVGVTGTTDAAGYYAVSMDQQTAQALASEKELFVQVSDAQGTVLQRADTPVQIQSGAAVRSELIVPVKTAPQSLIARATVIYRGAPGGKSTPLENIKGIGPAIAAKLRAAGIPDVETLLRTPGAKLVEIAGFDADVLRKEAASAVREGEAAPKESAPPRDAASEATTAERPPRARRTRSRKTPKK